MYASTIVVALFAAAAAALPQGAVPAPSSAPSSAPAPASSGGATCNLLSCATALGPAGAKCVDFAFGGAGHDCVQAVLDDIEQMPTPCADCLNALFA